MTSYSMFRVAAHILIKNRDVFQSCGFSRLIYLGKLEVVIEALCRQLPDEIIVTSLDGDISNELRFHSAVLDQINLPLIIGGGVSKVDFTAAPVERFLFNSALFDETGLDMLEESAAGFQSSLGYLPFCFDGSQLLVFDSSRQSFTPVDISWLRGRAEVVQEFVFLDALGQGVCGAFTETILEFLPADLRNRAYFSGGASPPQLAAIKDAGAAGYVIDNVSLYCNSLIVEEYHAAV